jgi:hypothetical protein
MVPVRGAGSASVARQTDAFVSRPKDAATGWWTVLSVRNGRWPVARACVCRRLLAISQDGPFADRGNKEARLGFVVSSLRCEQRSVAGVRSSVVTRSEFVARRCFVSVGLMQGSWE